MPLLCFVSVTELPMISPGCHVHVHFCMRISDSDQITSLTAVAVSLLEDVYIFTDDTQTLSFAVGYRECDISLLLDISNCKYIT